MVTVLLGLRIATAGRSTLTMLASTRRCSDTDLAEDALKSNALERSYREIALVGRMRVDVGCPDSMEPVRLASHSSLSVAGYASGHGVGFGGGGCDRRGQRGNLGESFRDPERRPTMARTNVSSLPGEDLLADSGGTQGSKDVLSKPVH